MTAEVHRLTGAGPIIEPEPEIIAELEGLLARAMAGDLKGFGFFTVSGMDLVGTGWVPGCARENDMVSGAARLAHR